MRETKEDRVYYKDYYRLARNRSPIGGPWRVDFGHWEPDRMREKRDMFRIKRTLRVGTREACERIMPLDEFQKNLRRLGGDYVPS